MVWVIFTYKSEAIWHDIKVLYFLGGTVSFLIIRTAIISTKKTDQKVTLFIIPAAVIMITGGVEAFFGQLQVWGNHNAYHKIFKVTGTFFNPSLFAGFLLASFPFVLFIISTPRKSKWMEGLYWVSIIAAALILSIMPITQSRAGWLGLISAGILWFFYYYDFSEKLKILFFNKRKALVVATGISIASITIGYGLYHFKKDSADGRFLIWKVACQLVLDKPILGHGFNTFQANYISAQAKYFEERKGSQKEKQLAGSVNWAFNELLQLAVELGIPGAILFILLLGYAVFFRMGSSLRKEERIIIYTARSCITGIMVFSFFSYPFYSLSITLLLFYSLGILSGYAKKSFSVFSYQINATLILLMLGLIIHSHFLTPRLKESHWLWEEAYQLYEQDQYEIANESFQKAYPTLQYNGKFLQHYGKSLVMTKNSNEAIRVLKKGGKYYKDEFWYITLGDANKVIKNYDEAERYYVNAHHAVPHKLYSRYLLAKLYDEIGQHKNAKKIAKEILKKKAKVMSRAIEEIKKKMTELLNEKQYCRTKKLEAKTDNLNTSSSELPIKKERRHETNITN